MGVMDVVVNLRKGELGITMTITNEDKDFMVICAILTMNGQHKAPDEMTYMELCRAIATVNDMLTMLYMERDKRNGVWREES